MNVFKSALLVLAFCFVAAVARAQGDPPSDDASGLDIFYPGMTVGDAQKQGAVKVDGLKMKGSVIWNGIPWEAVLLCKNDEVAVVALKAKHIDDAKISAFLKDMQERLDFPFIVTLKSGEKKTQTEYVDYVVQGKRGDALVEIFKKDVQAFLQNGEGSMTTMFCNEQMISAIAENEKINKTEEEQDVIIEKFSDYPVYSIRLNKATDGVVVIASRFVTMHY